MKINIPKDREEAVLAWFDAQPKNEDGSVTIEHDGSQSVPPEVLGLSREMLNSVPKVKIGTRVSQKMLDRLEGLKKR